MATEFPSLAISPDLKTVVTEMGFTTLTPIQAESIPVLLEGHDLIGQSKTGSGKTLAFSIPLLEKIDIGYRQVQALVLCPTRELCTQVAKEVRRLGRRLPGLQVLIVSGGLPGRPQADALRSGVHIVVGTPGRVLDHLDRRNLDCHSVTTLVLDEADRMLDMGFEMEMQAILEQIPTSRQTVFFSATFPDSIQGMSKKYQVNPQHVIIQEAPEQAPKIRQIAYHAEQDHKPEMLLKILRHFQPESAIIFCNQKLSINELAVYLEKNGINNSYLHGDLEQQDRNRIMALFKNGSIRFLIATDVAARGLDIENLAMVVNFDLPHMIDDYIHRIGRTGRAGKSGIAISTTNARERMRLFEFERETKNKVEDGRFDTHEVDRTAASTERAPDMQTIEINGGRKEKLRPGDILGALTGEAGLKGDTVGKIEIHDHIAYVAVKRSIAPIALERLSSGKIKGRKFLFRFV